MSGENPFEISEAPQTTARPEQGIAGPNLLEMEEADAAKRMMQDWDQSHKYVRNDIEMWKVNVLRSEGYTGVRLNKVQDEARAYIPWTATPNLTAMNQAGRLKRRVRALLFADPPRLEGTPSSDEDEDRDAAEFATRVLDDQCSEGNLSYNIKAADAFDSASDYASAFIRFWVDPTGGGWRPKELQAAPVPQATAQDPLYQPGTRIPWAKEDGTIPDPVIRYVKQDGTLTDQKNDPDIVMQWLPKIREEELDGRHVRLIPHTARDIWDAQGAMVGAMVPLGVLKGIFPQLMQMAPEKLREIVNARPTSARDLLPKSQQQTPSDISDATLVFTLSRYQYHGSTYPKGAYLCCAGADTMLHREELWDETHAEPLDIPITQFKQFNRKDKPNGIALMDFLGPGNELRAYLFGYYLDHLERLANRPIWAPVTGVYTDEQLQNPMGQVFRIVPGTEPKYGEVPDLPNDIKDLFVAVKDDLNDEAGVYQEAAAGTNPPGVKSGLHFQQIVEQTTQALSDLRQNTERGFVRGGRIILQLIRARFSVPTRVKWTGDDGSYKEQAFVGADLGSTRDVRMAKGSFTQLAPSAKAAMAEQMFAVRDPVTGEGILGIDELRSVMSGNVGGQLAVQDNPHVNRVRRQINMWRKGPPQGAQPPPPMLDPTTGQPVQPPDPVAAGIFAPVPADDEPAVARLRAYELGRAIASTRFGRWPAPWQQAIADEYIRMRQAAGIQTVAEQQAAAQQQLDAQNQQAMVAEQAKDQTAQQQQKLVAEIQAIQQQIKATQQQLAQLRKAIEPAIKEAVAPIAEAVETVSGEVQELAKAQGQGAEQLAKVGQNVADALDEQEEELRGKLEAQQEKLEERVLRLAETLKPGANTVNLPPGEEHATALSQLADAVEKLANRPTSFKVVKREGGKVIEPIAASNGDEHGEAEEPLS